MFISCITPQNFLHSLNQDEIIKILKNVNAKDDVDITYGENSKKTIKKDELNFFEDEQWLIHIGTKVCYIKLDSIYEVSFNANSSEKLMEVIPNIFRK